MKGRARRLLTRSLAVAAMIVIYLVSVGGLIATGVTSAQAARGRGRGAARGRGVVRGRGRGVVRRRGYGYGPTVYGYGPRFYGYRGNSPNDFPVGTGAWWRAMDRYGRAGRSD
jgi:hypothetical protein